MDKFVVFSIAAQKFLTRHSMSADIMQAERFPTEDSAMCEVRWLQEIGRENFSAGVFILEIK